GFGVVTEAIAQFIGFAGVDKILYASGGMHFHPQPIVELLSRLEFPDRLLERYRIEQLTPADRAAILGGNYARMVGLDVERVRARTAGDEFDRARAEHGR